MMQAMQNNSGNKITCLLPDIFGFTLEKMKPKNTCAYQREKANSKYAHTWYSNTKIELLLVSLAFAIAQFIAKGKGNKYCPLNS